MKNLILSLLAAFATLIGFAQTVSFGVKGGANFSTQSLSGYALYGNIAKSTSITGFNVGGIVDIAFNSFSIQSGLFYSTKGSEIPAHPNQNPADGSLGYVFPTANFDLKYIELPVNLLYNASVSNTLSFQVGVGPYFGYGISAKTNTSFQMAMFSNDQSPGIHYKNPDYGVDFIAGIELEKRFLIDIQYGLGLANVSGNDNAYPATDIKNQVLSISVGYLFR